MSQNVWPTIMPFGPVTLIFYWPKKKIRLALISGTDFFGNPILCNSPSRNDTSQCHGILPFLIFFFFPFYSLLLFYAYSMCSTSFFLKMLFYFLQSALTYFLLCIVIMLTVCIQCTLRLNSIVIILVYPLVFN
jgi:hypothetical protein